MSTDSSTAPVSSAEHKHPAFLQHHFVNADQQLDSSKMGIWLFLVTEVLLFSGMFVAYAVYRSMHPEAFAEAFSTLNVWAGGFNTLVLLTSSWTMAMSINAIQRGEQKRMIYLLGATVLLAAVFMIVKYFEYSGKYEHGIFFGVWEPHGEHYGHLADVAYTSVFMNIYFVITGIHGVHVLIGMGIIAWVMSQGMKGRFSSEYYTHVEVTGLYWHLVDIIWIFLFPLLYLV